VRPQKENPTAAFPDTPTAQGESQADSVPDELLRTVSFNESARVIGRYQIRQTLGAGGFGTVYRAYDPDLNREVAIKVPNEQNAAKLGDDAYLVEARNVAKLDHPNIVPVYDVGRTPEGLCYFVSKLVHGGSLEHRMKSARPSFVEAAELVASVADGLHHAHQQGLVHRDVKPANVLLDEKGKPLIADFGLALSDEEFGKCPSYSGTVVYMSPEQARGESHLVDARSDVYSLGVMFFELLTGKNPYRSNTMQTLLSEISTVEVRPPRQLNDAVPEELNRICCKSLTKNAIDRYSTARDFANDLRRWLATQCDSGLSRLYLLVGCVAIFMVGAAIVLGLIRGQERPSVEPTFSPSHSIGKRLDVLAWSPKDPSRRGMSLRTPGTLPLKNGDQIRVEVDVEKPAYLYLIWIDSEGNALPVYPWKPGDWQSLPPKQTPLSHLSLPNNADEGWPMQGVSGMETLVLFVRSEPLPSDVDLQSFLTDLPKQPLQGAESIVWIADGELIRSEDESMRGLDFGKPEQISDSILRAQRQIQERLGKYFSEIRAVSFAHR
jgi:serine/threonine protein kinase